MDRRFGAKNARSIHIITGHGYVRVIKNTTFTEIRIYEMI